MRSRAYWILSTVVAPIFVLILLGAIVKPVHAATLTVGVSPGCGSIQSCVNTAVSGDTVRIPAGVYVESITLNKAVSLVGAGFNSTIIRAASLQRTLTISDASIGNSIQVRDMRLQNGNLNGTSCSAGFILTDCGGGVLVAGGAAPTLSNLIIRNNSAYRGGGLFVDEGSVLPPINNVTIFRNSSLLSGGNAYFSEEITFQNGVIEEGVSTANVAGGVIIRGDSTFENTQFIDNTATCTSSFGICHGGGLYGFEVNLTIRNSYFENNHCSNPFDFDCDGGAIYWSRSFNGPYTVQIENTDFVDNSAARNGGALYMGGQLVDSLQIDRGRFEGNTAVLGDGGGVLANTAVISGTQFFTNTAGGRNGSFSEGGGGINIAYTTTITNAYFLGNHSEDRGGAIESFRGPVTVNGSTFEGNLARDNGGAIYVQIAGATIQNSRIEANRTYTNVTSNSFGNGGGIHLAGDLSLIDSQLISNTASRNGGGAYVSGGTVIVDNGRFERNIAQATLTFFSEGGGGLYVSGGNATISNSTFISNRVNGLGGGLYTFAPLTLHNTQLEANEATGTNSSGGGLYGRVSLASSGATEFINNQATNSGGGAYVNGTAVLEETNFTQNQAANFSGGGLYVVDQVTLDNVQFFTNTANSSGGGFYSSDVTTITNSLIQGNVSNGSGGGIGGSFDPVTGTNVQIVGNTAVNNGGGFSRNGNINLTNSEFRQNQSTTAAGGGLYTSGSIDFTNVDFTNNTAQTNGGGAFVNSNATLNGGTFSQNQAVTGSGGGLYNWSQTTANGTEFFTNTAQANGGGLHNNFRALLSNLHIQNNIASGHGGGISIFRFATITATRVISNRANIGGGIAISGTSSGSAENHIINVLLAQNEATTAADGLHHHLGRTLNLIHTTIANPTQTSNQGVYVTNGSVFITNTIVVSHGVGIEVAGTGTATPNYVNYFNNGTNEVGTTGSNQFLGDPLFVSPSDHRLVVGSTAMDIGVNGGIVGDILNVGRPSGLGFDLGAYEGAHTPTAVSLITFSVNNPPSIILTILLSCMLLLSLYKLRSKMRKQL